MHAITTEPKSTPTTIRAHVNIERVGDRVIERMKKGKSSNHSITQSPDHSILPTPPRFVVTLESPLAATDSLTRIPLAITGKWVRDGHDFSITLDDLNEIVRNFGERRNGEINVDYDHASEMPEVAAGGPIPSAGRIVRLEEPEEDRSQETEVRSQKATSSGIGQQTTDDERSSSSIVNGQSSIVNSGETRTPNPESRFVLYGLYEPTERARQLIERREYRYISPAIQWAGRDKRTGKIAGTTLTSVALTNRPFLEELPQIRLSDPGYQLVEDGVRGSGLGVREGRSQFHLSSTPDTRHPNPGSAANPEPQIPNPDPDHGRPSSIANHQSQIANFLGGKMKQVKLSVQDGAIRVEHADFPDAYCAAPEDIQQCLSDLGAAPEPALAEELAELAGMAARDPESGIRPRPDGVSGNPESPAQPAVALSECVAEIRRRLAARQEISLEVASALLSETEAAGKSIPAADFFRWRVEQELDEAVKAGKCLPRQREDWRKIALSDFPTFRKIVAAQKPQVALRPAGLSGSGPDDPQSQVKLLAEQRMRERQISFGQALSEIGREHPELVHQYRRAVSA